MLNSDPELHTIDLDMMVVILARSRLSDLICPLKLPGFYQLKDNIKCIWDRIILPPRPAGRHMPKPCRPVGGEVERIGKREQTIKDWLQRWWL